MRLQAGRKKEAPLPAGEADRGAKINLQETSGRIFK